MVCANDSRTSIRLSTAAAARRVSLLFVILLAAGAFAAA
jgi:hypothetical protein